MRVGLLGLGRIGAFHAGTLAGLVDDLVVHDENRELAERTAAALGARTGDPFDADAVVIATPTGTHAELITEACGRGIPAFCEKPVALDLPATLKVADAVRRSDALVHIGFQRRFDAGYQAAREALHSGDLGRLDRVHLVTGDPAPPHPAYLPKSGGIFRDLHIHDFDALRWVTGREVESVYAIGANRGSTVFADYGDVDNSAAVLTLDDGTLVTLQGSRYNGGGYDVRMELAGSHATRVVGLGPRAPLTSAEGFAAVDPWPGFQSRFEAAYRAELVAFLDAARGSWPSPCSVEEALAALYVAEAADLSYAQARQVRIAEVVV